jgi:hypothetical protein
MRHPGVRLVMAGYCKWNWITKADNSINLNDLL